jgi:hypothetical protein
MFKMSRVKGCGGGTASRSPTVASTFTRKHTMAVPRPDVAAQLVQEPGQSEIYLVDDKGFRRHIPNLATLTNLFGDSPTINRAVDVATISDGIPFSDGAVLAKAQGKDEIYLVNDRQKTHISSIPVLNKYQFRGHVWEVPRVLVDYIPTNKVDISSPT